MTAPAVTTCPGCDGGQTVVVEVRGTDVEVPCTLCSCAVCGQATDTPPECGDCFSREDTRARRRADV